MYLCVTALIGRESGSFNPLALTKNLLIKSKFMFRRVDVGAR